MASKPNTSSTGQEPQHFQAPGARELRAQAVNRLMVGLSGLAAMLLLVGLANIIMDHARQTDAAAVQSGSNAVAPAANSDPLADIGAVPSPEASGRTVRPSSNR